MGVSKNCYYPRECENAIKNPVIMTLNSVVFNDKTLPKNFRLKASSSNGTISNIDCGPDRPLESELTKTPHMSLKSVLKSFNPTRKRGPSSPHLMCPTDVSLFKRACTANLDLLVSEISFWRFGRKDCGVIEKRGAREFIACITLDQLCFWDSNFNSKSSTRNPSFQKLLSLRRALVYCKNQ